MEVPYGRRRPFGPEIIPQKALRVAKLVEGRVYISVRRSRVPGRWFSLLQNRRLIRGIFDTYSFVIYVFVVKVSSTYFGVPPARTGDEIVFQELDKLSWIIRRKTVWACRRPGSVPMGWRQLFLKRMKEKDGRDSRIYIGKNGDKRWWPKMVAYPRDGSCLFETVLSLWSRLQNHVRALGLFMPLFPLRRLYHSRSDPLV